MCSNKTQSIIINAKITAHKNLKNNSIDNFSFLIKVKKVNEPYIYCYGLLEHRHYLSKFS
jgi:hypothetical protein